MTMMVSLVEMVDIITWLDMMKMMLTCVDMVSRVVTPRATLAGTALGSSQKFTLSRSFFCSNLGFDCWYKRWQLISNEPKIR